MRKLDSTGAFKLSELVDELETAVPRVRAALDAALAQIAAPAVVLDASGNPRELNSAARNLFDSDPRGVRDSLRDAVLRRPSRVRWRLTALKNGHGATGWLAVLEPGVDERLPAAVAAAAARWGLTPRQREVLELVVQGAANVTIATTLGLGVRAVELHVSAIFDRAGVENRAALVASVLARG